MAKSLVLGHLLEVWQSYFQMEGITEIVVNKPKELYLDIHNNFQKVIDEKINEYFLMDFVEQLATHRNLFFNLNVPHLSCSVPDSNIRVQALHPSITAQNHLSLTMRIPSKQIFGIESFVIAENLANKGITYEYLKNLIVSKKNILVSGGTGSGKTSFINALLQYLPQDERIVSIEDSAELRISNPNLVSIIVSKNDQTTYSYKDGLNDAMRMRPDRIFVGEIDTRNTMLFLRLSNTGHDGMVSTIHSNSVEEAIHAITLNAKFNGSDIDVKNIVEYFASAIDFVIQIKKSPQGRIIHSILDVKKHFSALLNRANSEVKALE